MAPLSGRMTHDAARNYARGLAQRLADLNPKHYLLYAPEAAGVDAKLG